MRAGPVTTTTASITPSAGDEWRTERIVWAGRFAGMPRALRARAARFERTSEFAERVFGHPAGELLHLADTREHLEHADGEVAQELLGIGQLGGRGALRSEVILVCVFGEAAGVDRGHRCHQGPISSGERCENYSTFGTHSKNSG